MSFHVPEKDRIVKGQYASTEAYGNSGAFHVRDKGGTGFFVIASDQGGWEHVSVSRVLGVNETPTWKDMCFIKNTFWDPEDCVVQFHPPKSLQINHCKGCLHLWKPVQKEIPMPPTIMV